MTFAEMAAIMDAEQPSAEQEAAEQAANAKLTAEHPGQYVAFRDHWDGKELRREVVAAAVEYHEYVTQIRRFSDKEQDTFRAICIPADPRIAQITRMYF